MHGHRRHGAGCPRSGRDVEDLHRLRRLPGADEIEASPDLDVSGLESRDVLPLDLENLPPPTTGPLRVTWATAQRDCRRDHQGRENSCLNCHIRFSLNHAMTRSLERGRRRHHVADQIVDGERTRQQAGEFFDGDTSSRSRADHESVVAFRCHEVDLGSGRVTSSGSLHERTERKEAGPCARGSHVARGARPAAWSNSEPRPRRQRPRCRAGHARLRSWPATPSPVRWRCSRSPSRCRTVDRRRAPHQPDGAHTHRALGISMNFAPTPGRHKETTSATSSPFHTSVTLVRGGLSARRSSAEPMRPPTEETWKMCPQCCSRMIGGTALVTYTTPKKLVSIWTWKLSMVMSSFAARSAYRHFVRTRDPPAGHVSRRTGLEQSRKRDAWGPKRQQDRGRHEWYELPIRSTSRPRDSIESMSKKNGIGVGPTCP